MFDLYTRHSHVHIWLHSCPMTTSSSSSAGVVVVVVFGGAAHFVVSVLNNRPDERRKVCMAVCRFKCIQRTFTSSEQCTQTNAHTHTHQPSFPSGARIQIRVVSLSSYAERIHKYTQHKTPNNDALVSFDAIGKPV